jgi:hypothetical protein
MIGLLIFLILAIVAILLGGGETPDTPPFK